MKVRPIVFDGEIAYVNLTKGYWAVIEASDAHLVDFCNWHAHVTKNTVYARSNRTKSDGKRYTVFMHREILQPDNRYQVDHVDHNGLNNRRENLRLCNKSQNQFNRYSQPNNTSGFRGVTWHKYKQKWMCQIKKDGKNKCLGYFGCAHEAYKEYQKASRKFHGDFSNV